MSGEEFLQKFGLHLGPISNAPRPQGVKPIFYFILQCEREKLEPYQVQSGSILLEGVANLLKFPDVCIGILTLHTMEGGEKWHQVRPNNHVLSWGYNAGWCTHSQRVYVVPHGPESIEVPLRSLLTLLLFMCGFHLITIQAHFTTWFLWNTDFH